MARSASMRPLRSQRINMYTPTIDYKKEGFNEAAAFAADQPMLMRTR